MGFPRLDRAVYRLAYGLLYRVGAVFWRRADPPAELRALIEGPDALPAGRALDLGCGTGTDTVYLAGHGFDATGVDMMGKAIAVARRNAEVAGVAPRLVNGDVTHLGDLGVDGGFTLLLDYRCFHALPEDQRIGYLKSVSEAAAPAPPFCCTGSAETKPRRCVSVSQPMR